MATLILFKYLDKVPTQQPVVHLFNTTGSYTTASTNHYLLCQMSNAEALAKPTAMLTQKRETGRLFYGDWYQKIVYVLYALNMNTEGS